MKETKYTNEVEKLVVNAEKWVDLACGYQTAALNLRNMLEDIAITSNESFTVDREKLALKNFERYIKEIHFKGD